MKAKTVYLAGAIDKTDFASGYNWRREMGKQLTEKGHASFNPLTAFSGGHLSPVFTRAVNEAALDKADIVVVCYMAGQETWGTPIEVDMAKKNGKTIVVFNPGMKFLPSYLQGMADVETSTIKETVQYISCEAKQTNIRHTGGGIFAPAYQGDEGYDLAAMEDTVLEPYKITRIPVGDDTGILHVELPSNKWCTVFSRSSTITKLGIFVFPTVIDNGYRGEIFIFVINLGVEAITIAKEQRIAQLVLHGHQAVFGLEKVNTLTETHRGKLGFGSTGV